MELIINTYEQLYMINPNWLHTFKTLIDIGHFTKTAEKLFMTQPGVSQHINKLEQACGHSLILREKKSFELTEQGRLVYKYAERMIVNEHDLLENLGFDDPYSGHVTLACSGALALILYPQLLNLQYQHPKLITQLKAAPNHQILDEIQQGTTDIGIVTHIPNPRLFDVEELGQEQLCLVLPKGVDSKNCNTQSLMELGLISHPDAEHYLSLYFAQSDEVNFSNIDISMLPTSGFINQISQILEPVAKGLGFTVLPKSAVDSFKNPKKLTLFKRQKPVMEPLYRVKKKNRVLPARFNAVKDVISRAMENF